MGQKVVYQRLDPEFLDDLSVDELTEEELGELAAWEEEGFVAASAE